MEKIIKLLCCICCIFELFSCSDKPGPPPNPTMDISDIILGEWVYDNPIDGAWQSMKFTKSGKFFYSEKKEEWSSVLKQPGGNYSIDGMNISAFSTAGLAYIDMTIQTIDDYSFTTRYKNSDLDVIFYKVLMRLHLNFEESVVPLYSELVDKQVTNYKSHDEAIASVDPVTGEITAKVENGRTYIDVTTTEGTACIKVMIGDVNDGDEKEISTIPTKETISLPVMDITSIAGPLWVYDHPEEKIWEIIQFDESGTVSFSNENRSLGIESEASGTYSIDQKTIKGMIDFPEGPMDFHWVVTALTNFEFTVKAFSSGSYVGQFTYAKQLDAIELTVGDTEVPDYKQYMGNTTIKGFKSHNDALLTVNNETGELTAVARGRTYVDVITEDGTAVLMVKINKKKELFALNYEEYLGVTWNVIGNTFGTAFENLDGGLYYDYSKGSINYRLNTILDDNWSFIYFAFDSDPYASGRVNAIVLSAKSDVWFTAEEMYQYLKEHYYVYEKGTTDDNKAFINNEDYDNATVGITWDMKKMILTLVTITHVGDPIFDYGRYIGKTRDEAKDMMKKEFGANPLTDSETILSYYNFGSDYITSVMFKFDSNGNINYLQVKLIQGVDPSIVNDELSKEYGAPYDSDGTYFYQTTDGKVRITYTTASNAIVFQVR